MFVRYALGRLPSSRFGCLQRPFRPHGTLPLILLHMMRFKLFSMPRWAKVSTATRGLVSAFADGHGETVNLLFRDPTASRFFFARVQEGELFDEECCTCPGSLEQHRIEIHGSHFLQTTGWFSQWANCERWWTSRSRPWEACPLPRGVDLLV